MSISPELTAGAGFTFEDSVSAMYLASLLSESTSHGLGGRIVQCVSLQQAPDEPLDDVIVDASFSNGDTARLSIQVKRSLIISAAKENKHFREIVINSWKTLKKNSFKQDVDRYGGVTGSITENKFRSLNAICEWARNSESAQSFITRFGENGHASAEHRKIKEAIASLLTEVIENEPSDSDLHEFFKHFLCIRIDTLHEGATTPTEQINLLAGALHESDKTRSVDLWISLQRIAREGAGKRAIFDRVTLLNLLKQRFRFSAVPSLLHDIKLLNQKTDEAIQDISSDIIGFEISRKALLDEIKTCAQEHRFIQVRGLPGTGKSAVLKLLTQEARNAGSVFFLKHDMLSGRSWLEFATSIGLENKDIKLLLTEISATGQSYLLIDGIDRIEYDQRKIINALISEILDNPELDDWRIIATARDAGIELLKNWLPRKLFNEGQIGIVDTHSFNDEEALELSRRIPSLRELLFGAERVREIARRPFFTAVLAREISGANKDDNFSPRSEIDLIDRWWSQGGYNAEQNVHQRQQALMDLAKQNAYRIGRDIKISSLQINTRDLLGALIIDGIIQHQNQGHTVKFAHDIFFEWSFLHHLIDLEEDWINEIIFVGQPPALGRVVELLSQAFFTEGEWKKSINLLSTNKVLRPQWIRAWITGPLNAPHFNEHCVDFDAIVDANNHELLYKLLVWFQAERTVPNPLVLNKTLTGSNLSERETVRIADMLSWPSDTQTWHRLIEWLLDRLSKLPKALIPNVVSIFEVWQNAFFEIKNSISEKILTQSSEWLADIEEFHHPERWAGLLKGQLYDLEKTLRTLILMSARSFPHITKEYLDRITPLKHIRQQIYDEVIVFSPILSQVYPQLLANIARVELMEELPEDKLKREREKQQAHSDYLMSIREKPETERTQREKQALSNNRFIRSPNFSFHDWDHLSINNNPGCYFPPSPLREPFNSLYTNSPDVARSLTCDIANHAITAWKQLHQINYRKYGTPIPIELDFPSGQKEFWGNTKIYVWGRGQCNGPQAVECAFLALDNWAFKELDKGRNPDEVIQDVLNGHTSVGALAIAVAILISSEQVSKATLPIITNQRLWHFDIGRWMNEASFVGASQIGFNSKADITHLEAVQKINARSCRKTTLRQLAPLFVFCKKDEIYQKTKDAIEQFPENLPFSYQEDIENPEILNDLKKTAESWAEWGKRDNYKIIPHPEDENIPVIQLENPKISEPETQAAIARGNETTRKLTLWNWVQKTYEMSQIPRDLTLSEAIQLAKQIDHPNIFMERDDIPDLSLGAVAGTAAITINFDNISSDEEKKWAKEILDRAFLTPEKKGNTWSSSSILPWHPCLFVARALASEIKKNPNDQVSKEKLFRLIGHPLEQIFLESITQALDCWDIEPRFSWYAIDLGLRLSIGSKIKKERLIENFDPNSDINSQFDTTKAIIKNYNENTDFCSLTSPPDAWIFAPLEQDELSTIFGDTDVDAPHWRDPDTFWCEYYAAKVLSLLPIKKIMNNSQCRDILLDLCDKMLNWTIERINPSWAQDDDRVERKNRDTNLFEWQAHLSKTLACVASNLTAEEVIRRYLQRFSELNDELCISFITSFIDLYVCINVLDPQNVSPEAIQVIDYCLDRILQHPTFKPSGYKNGEIDGFDLPKLIPTLLFVHVEANGAKRFANGEWQDINLVMPIIDKLISKAGWMPAVATEYLTLCERAIKYYPIEKFTEQMLSILTTYSSLLVCWRGTMIPARIASLVQSFSEDNQPLEMGIVQKLLYILDTLVDMGDRRSAALQNSEVFRNIRIATQ